MHPLLNIVERLQAFLYFHWLRPSPRKISYYRRFAVSRHGVQVRYFGDNPRIVTDYGLEV